LYPEPLSKARKKRILVEKYNRAIAPGNGFRSLREFESLIKQLPLKNGGFKKLTVARLEGAPEWAPLEMELWMKDTMEALQYILGDPRLASEMKWSPEKLYNSENHRVYSELWTADWWWRTQVCVSAFCNLIIIRSPLKQMFDRMTPMVTLEVTPFLLSR
jgi:hypothetical protein